MKKFKNIKKWSAIALSVLAIASCSSNFLDRPPLDSVTDFNFYKTDDQVMAGTALLYNQAWVNYNIVASFNLGDYRGGTACSYYSNQDNVWFATTAGTMENAQAWQGLFNVIAQSNTAIGNINKYAGSGVTPAVKQEAIGEARFMRSLAYRYLVMNWGPVPIITDNVALLADPLSVRLNTVSSVWKFITNEMRAAEDELPDVAPAPGRLTKWSAEGMLARFYLARASEESSNGVRNQAFLDSAKYYAQRVITLSGKQLLSNYRDLFLFDYNNNNESLFELQYKYGDHKTVLLI